MYTCESENTVCMSGGAFCGHVEQVVPNGRVCDADVTDSGWPAIVTTERQNPCRPNRERERERCRRGFRRV